MKHSLQKNAKTNAPSLVWMKYLTNNIFLLQPKPSHLCSVTNTNAATQVEMIVVSNQKMKDIFLHCWPVKVQTAIAIMDDHLDKFNYTIFFFDHVQKL